MAEFLNQLLQFKVQIICKYLWVFHVNSTCLFVSGQSDGFICFLCHVFSAERIVSPKKYQISGVWVHQETDINGFSQRESCINGKSDTKTDAELHVMSAAEGCGAWSSLTPRRQNRWWICSTGSLQPPVTEFSREGPEIFYELHKTRLGAIVHLHCQVCLISRLQKFFFFFLKGLL